MAIVLTILLILAGIITLLLFLALFTKKEYNVQREIIVNAPAQKVFDYVKYLRNQDHYNKWLMADPAMKKDFKGADGTVGFVYSWAGNKHGGAGEMEITSIVEGKSVATETRFEKPFAGIAPHAILTTESLSDHQTKVTWSNGSKIIYPVNVMLPMINKVLAKDLDTSLNNLKAILEK
jgi:uncharacterized protein YndB with AHSA1/START domain